MVTPDGAGNTVTRAPGLGGANIAKGDPSHSPLTKAAKQRASSCSPWSLHSKPWHQIQASLAPDCGGRPRTTIQDRDTALVPLLRHGGPQSPGQATGGHPTNKRTDTDVTIPLMDHFHGNWPAAEAEPDTIDDLLTKEIYAGWVVKTTFAQEQAQAHWPRGIAIGKLYLVRAEGRDPRLVLDSAVCGVNPRCHLPERVSLPMASDLCLAFQPEDPPTAFIAASLDFKAAHNQVQVKADEHGLLMFQHRDTLFYYRVCHFGARFSAYWWQRVGALLLRILHNLLAHGPTKPGYMWATSWPPSSAAMFSNSWP